MRAPAGEHDPHGAQQNHDVQRHGHVLEIPEIEQHLGLHVLDAGVVLVFHLSPARNARLHLEAAQVKRHLMPKLVDKMFPFGPGTHQAHLPGQHVPKLRQFIQTGAPQEVPEPGDAGIPLGSPLRAERLGIGAHGAEFIETKTTPILADSLLGIERRSRGIPADEHDERQHKGPGQEEAEEGRGNVQQALEIRLPAGHVLRKEFLERDAMQGIGFEMPRSGVIEIGDDENRQGKFRHVGQHPHDLVMRGGFVADDHAAGMKVSDEVGKFRVFPQHGQAGELLAVQGRILIHETHGLPAQFRGGLKFLADARARFSGSENQHALLALAAL